MSNLMEIRIECDNNINGRKCGKLLFKVIGNVLQIKCRNSKCKTIKHIDINKLLKLSAEEHKTKEN